MGRRAAALVATVAAALVAPHPAGAAEVVERVVAVIRSPASPQARVVTLTRVEDETRVALVARGGTLAATARLDGKALRAGLEWVIEQTLLADEAARLQIFEVDPADVAAELQRFRARFATPAEYEAFLARFDLGVDDLSAILARTLRVNRYVESRAGRAADLPEPEVRAYVAAHAAELPRDAAAARAAARALLGQERFAAEARVLAADLRARAEVRILHDVGAEG